MALAAPPPHAYSSIIITWNVRFDEKIVEYKDPDIPIGYDENMVLEEVEKAIKLYEENKDLDTGNMEVSEDEEEPTGMASV